MEMIKTPISKEKGDAMLEDTDLSLYSLHSKVELILVLAELGRVCNGAVSGAPYPQPRRSYRLPTNTGQLIGEGAFHIFKNNTTQIDSFTDSQTPRCPLRLVRQSARKDPPG